MSTAFVTGATGFVGINLVRQLAEAGWDLHILCRPSSQLQDLSDLDLHIHRGDITDIDSLRRAMPQAVDAVFHVAASTNVWAPHNTQQTHINVQGTANVLEVALAHKAQRFIHTSTFAVWGFQHGTFDEQTPMRQDADWMNYVRTKRAAQDLVKQAHAKRGLDAVILHPSHILGPYDRHNWSRMIRMVNEGSLPGVPPGGGVFADVRQVAAAHIQAFHRGRSGQHYLLGGQQASYLELVAEIGRQLGRPVPRRSTPAVVLKLVALVQDYWGRVRQQEPDLTPEGAAMITQHMNCDSRRAIDELNYQQTPLAELVRDTCEWMRSAGLLESS